MKRFRVRSIEELRALPEGEWVEVVGPMKWDIADASLEVRGERVIVDLTAKAARKLKPRKGVRLTARFEKGKLVVERRAATRRRRNCRRQI